MTRRLRAMVRMIILYTMNIEKKSLNYFQYLGEKNVEYKFLEATNRHPKVFPDLVHP